jgi:hypothetical protein
MLILEGRKVERGRAVGAQAQLVKFLAEIFFLPACQCFLEGGQLWMEEFKRRNR